MSKYHRMVNAWMISISKILTKGLIENFDQDYKFSQLFANFELFWQKFLSFKICDENPKKKIKIHWQIYI